MSLDARTAAHRILRDCRNGTFADQSVGRILPQVTARDRGLAHEIAYGVLRLRQRLDTELASLTDRPLDKVDPSVHDWLRMGLYQLRELRVPDHAAVSETVRLARRSMDAGRAGFINAVLRAATRDRPDPFPSRDTRPVEYLTTYGSHPEWLVRRWLDRWGWHDTFRLVRHDNRRPDVVLRLPPGMTIEAARRLVGDDFTLEPVTGFDRSARLSNGEPGALLDRVPGVIQDPAASAVVDFVGDAFEGPVYDACAAPGTKSLGLYASGAGARPHIAADVSLPRLRSLVEAVRERALDMACVVADARRPPVAGAGTVLVDVPCSGTGVLGRRPDLRWRLTPESVEALVELQREILDGAADVVAPGGSLIYATCSLEAEENELQVEHFLNRHGDFERVSTGGTGVPEHLLTEAGDLLVRPWATDTDGAYAARLRRRG